MGAVDRDLPGLELATVLCKPGGEAAVMEDSVIGQHTTWPMSDCLNCIETLEQNGQLSWTILKYIS